MKVFFSAIILCTILFYTGAVVIFVLTLVYYTDAEGCTLNKVFVGVNLVLGFIVSILAVLPKIQEREYARTISNLVCFLNFIERVRKMSPKHHARELLIAAGFYYTHISCMRFLKKQKHKFNQFYHRNKSTNQIKKWQW